MLHCCLLLSKTCMCILILLPVRHRIKRIMSDDQHDVSSDSSQSPRPEESTELSVKQKSLPSLSKTIIHGGLPNLGNSSPEVETEGSPHASKSGPIETDETPFEVSPQSSPKLQDKQGGVGESVFPTPELTPTESDDRTPGLVISHFNSQVVTPGSSQDDGTLGGATVEVVASHYNAMEEIGLRERTKSRIFYMRNFNNWIKSTLIGEYLNPLKRKLGNGAPLRVLDLGCGKGGDLLKWMRGGVTHVVCADVAEISVQHCESRYKEMASRNRGQISFTAQFITADCTKVRLRNMYKKPSQECIDPTLKFHLVSCQFAFHYCFESLAQANCMMQNAAECLENGGYFIGTIPNAYEIVRRHKEASADSFGNDIYKITMEEASKGYPLFGAMYNFHLHEVVDCPEFLVHFPTLVKLAEKHGLRLVEKLTFNEFYAKFKDSGRFLLQKINGLEMFPPQREGALLGRDEDYSHASGYVKENPRVQSVGTLSQPEWEAASLYMMFAFEKVKRQMNLDDFPERSEPKKRRKTSEGSDKKQDR